MITKLSRLYFGHNHLPSWMHCIGFCPSSLPLPFLRFSASYPQSSIFNCPNLHAFKQSLYSASASFPLTIYIVSTRPPQVAYLISQFFDEITIWFSSIIHIMGNGLATNTVAVVHFLFISFHLTLLFFPFCVSFLSFVRVHYHFF